MRYLFRVCFVLVHFIHSGSELFAMFIVQISFLTLACLCLLLFSFKTFLLRNLKNSDRTFRLSISIGISTNKLYIFIGM